MTDTTVTGWTGWGVFASVLLLIAGVFDLVFGFAAIIGPNSTLVITEEGLFAVNVASWGWWHILSGILLILVAGRAVPRDDVGSRRRDHPRDPQRDRPAHAVSAPSRGCR